MNLIIELQFESTPLNGAAWKNSVGVAELLTRSGADVNAKNHVSPLFILIYVIHYITILTLNVVLHADLMYVL